LEKIICKDFTVSGESFELHYNPELDLYATSPQPEEEQLSQYYQSKAYISHTDSRESFFDKIYQWVKWYAIQRKVKLIDSLGTSARKLLDVGCGTGSFLEAAAKKHWQVFGVEPNPDAQDLARQKLNKDACVFDSIEAFNSNAYLGTFDVITLWHVLEHVPDYDVYINKLKKLLTPTGILLIAVPNYKSYDASHYQSFWAAYDVPRHLWHFSPKAIRLIFKQHQLKVHRRIPMKWDAYYVALLSEKYITGTSNFLKAFYIGFLSNWKAKSSGNYSSLIYLIKKE